MAQVRTGAWSYVLDEPVRLLVADDDPIQREFSVVHLSTPVASVETAADGLEAWARLTAEAFDLALLDIDMPGLDGYELVARIRADAELRHLPVVVVTGREDIASIDRAYAAGATSFIAKPVNWRQLSHQLRYVLRTSRMEAEVRAELARTRVEAGLAQQLAGTLSGPLASIISVAARLVDEAEALAREAPELVGAGELKAGAGEIAAAGRELLRVLRRD